MGTPTPIRPEGQRVHPHVLGARWLASANSIPTEAFIHWKRLELAEITVGVTFNVVRITEQRLGLAALQDMQRASVAVGPVILNKAQRAVEFLVTATTHALWSMRDSEFIALGPGSERRFTLKCPPPGLPKAGGREWLVPPNGGQILTHPRHLAVALRRARVQLRSAGHSLAA